MPCSCRQCEPGTTALQTHRSRSIQASTCPSNKRRERTAKHTRHYEESASPPWKLAASAFPQTTCRRIGADSREAAAQGQQETSKKSKQSCRIQTSQASDQQPAKRKTRNVRNQQKRNVSFPAYLVFQVFVFKLVLLSVVCELIGERRQALRQ